jgi:hypothetical protein
MATTENGSAAVLEAPVNPAAWQVAAHAALCLLLEAAAERYEEGGHWFRADEMRAAGESLWAAWGHQDHPAL